MGIGSVSRRVRLLLCMRLWLLLGRLLGKVHGGRRVEVGRCELKGVFVARCSWRRERGVIHCRILQWCCGKKSCALGKDRVLAGYKLGGVLWTKK